MMAIEKNNVKAVSRLDSEFSVGSRSRESMSSDEDEFKRRDLGDSEDDDEFDDADSGAGSDDFDLLELGETGSEFCQVGDQTCCIPFELYDLPDLRGVLSLDVWNDCLTEEDRFGLTKYLPDMDEETFMWTLKELFEGRNFHFGSPITMLYQMLKGGMCEPRVALYRQGLRFFQTHQHYHLLRRHHDSMVSNLLQMREAWQHCKGYSIEEKLRVLNIVRSQMSLMGERNDDLRSDSSERESGEALLSMRLKGRGAGKRTGHDPVYGGSPAFDIFSGGRASGDVTKYGQVNAKGLLKGAGVKNSLTNMVSSHIPSGHYGQQGGIHGSNLVPSRVGKATMYDVTASGVAEQERIYNLANQGHWNGMDVRARSGKTGKKNEAFGNDECDGDSYTYLRPSAKTSVPAHGRNLNINQLSDITVLTARPSNVRCGYDPSTRSKYMDPTYADHMRLVKSRAPQMASKGNLAGYGDMVEPYWIRKAQGEAYIADSSYEYEYKDVDPRTLKLHSDFAEYRLTSQQASQHMEDKFNHHEKQAKFLHKKMRGTAVRNGGSNMFSSKGDEMFHGGEETPSDSSDQHEDEEDNIPLIMSKQAIRSRMEASRTSMSRSSFDGKKVKRTKKGFNENHLIFDGMLPDSSTMASYGRYMPRPELETYSSRSRQKAMMHNLETSQNFSARLTEDYYGDPRNLYKNDRESAYRLGSHGQVFADIVEGSPMYMNKASFVERRQKGTVGGEFSLHQSKNMGDYDMEQDGAFFGGASIGRSSRDLDATLIACASVKKKKRKEVPGTDVPDGSNYLSSHQQLSDTVPLKNWAKKRLETECGSPGASTSEAPNLDVVLAEPEVEVKPQKKTLPPITPTVHTGFSFSIIHLLSAVRMALIASSPDNAQKNIQTSEVEAKEQSAKHESANGTREGLDMNNQSTETSNAPSLTIQDIVNRVRSDPGDSNILETQEPLQDLVRGVLKIFSSKTAPLGAKGWKPLICYEKSSKSWSWTGPVPPSEADNETPEDVISPEAWRISRKMLVKLVDSYANWLKSGQETLQQIGSLPPPPSELMQLNIDEKERFKDLRAQKSLITITRSSDEVRDYFRKEEQLRYLVPDRAFSYTAADGKKSIVAPLRRCGGKPTSKARDHFMLKRDRPPHVTVLCLVRDAAARLPGSIGTRADVCTLIRDSQYIVEDVTDSQVNQVVSGALDRLHYERDPCVQFDGERKLWVYLHREREEEDFEDDGTSSTKKWKRQKKDASEQDDQVTVACHGNTEPNGLDMTSNLNVVPTCINGEKTSDIVCDDTRQINDEGKTVDVAGEADFQQILETRSQCQENSMNEEFYDGT